MAFTCSESPDQPNIAEHLESLSSRIPKDSTIGDIISFLSNGLVAKLTDADDGQESQESVDNDVSDDSMFGAAAAQEIQPVESSEAATYQPPWKLPLRDEMNLLRRSLQQAQWAGISVGLLPPVRAKMPKLVSLSLPVSRLGLADDALEAWGLEPDEYLVLLLHLTTGFPAPARYLELYSVEEAFCFRFGKCSSAKPSIASARAAFSDMYNRAGARHAVDEDTSSTDTQNDTSFMLNHMSTSVNRQLNNSLHKLIAIRREQKVSWNAAQEILRSRERGSGFQTPPSGEDCDDGAVISPQAPAALQHDYALDDEDDLSIPLIAMQLALRQLVRCTEFCTVCHKQLKDDGPGSLKPYVCTDPLCLFQYLSLGFGPSLEHEVINNPYVVDLLISFFYAAVEQSSLREFPAGLRLKAPMIGDLEQAAIAHLLVGRGELRVVGGMKRSIGQPRDHVALAIVYEAATQLFVCRITDVVDAEKHTFKLETVSGPFVQSEDAKEVSQFLEARCAAAEGGWVKALAFSFTHDPEYLPPEQQKTSLSFILLGIPSSLVLLDWIIASNRSHIVQDQPVVRSSESVDGGLRYAAEYLQFRFAQGSPHKERRFTQELKEHAVDRLGQAKLFPTLFAWHGSPLKNWHSIIRTGLDFSKRAHGRSYGDGVYMSQNMSVSVQYCGNSVGSVSKSSKGKSASRPLLPLQWIMSQLVPSQALSICEIVNRPELFVNRTPHYVVNKVEWIQCRYLLVKVDPTYRALAEPFPGRKTKTCSGFVPQETTLELHGLDHKRFEIPQAAIPAHRRSRIPSPARTRAETQAKPEQGIAEGPESFGRGDRLDLLTLSAEEVEVEPKGRKGFRDPSPSESSVPKMSGPGASGGEGGAAGGATAGEGPAAGSPLEFRPGSLDHGSLPKLPAPWWASTSHQALHALSKEVREMHQIQSRSPARELGWCVDTSKIDNLFHWIAELHSFDAALPLARDMARRGCASVVLEVRFGAGFPLSPPFVRVVRPRFLPFARGGGGHVTAGGAICSELLTGSGWSPALTMEKVLLQVRLGLCDLEPPARLDDRAAAADADYGIAEAAAAYTRAAAGHGWQVPADLAQMTHASWA
ncbi:hypothetical protein CDD83_6657 [Cordyceps sp. RAO-2017]|nr:hypothetical protein CDD83_6657 [Cordyceps sp. RAO-2017]